MDKVDPDVLKAISRLLSRFKRTGRLYADVKLPLGSVADLRALPVMSREALRCFARDHGIGGAYNVTATSGSSQERLLVVHSRACYQAHLARLTRLYRSVGVGNKDLCLNLCAYTLNSGGRLMESAYRSAGAGVIPFGVLDTPQKLDELVELVRVLRPTILNSYTNQLFDIFAALGKGHSIRKCIVNGEPLTDDFKKRIERMSGTRIYNHYGAMEVSGFAIAQTPSDKYMRIFDDGLLIEVLGDDGQASMKGEGAILVTDIFNRSMPFIRYKLGDRVDIKVVGRKRYVRVLGRLSDSILISGEVHSRQRMAERVQRAVTHPNFFVMVTKDRMNYRDKVILHLRGNETPRFEKIRASLQGLEAFRGRFEVRAFDGVFPKTTTGKFKHIIDARQT